MDQHMCSHSAGPGALYRPSLFHVRNKWTDNTVGKPKEKEGLLQKVELNAYGRFLELP